MTNVYIPQKKKHNSLQCSNAYLDNVTQQIFCTQKQNTLMHIPGWKEAVQDAAGVEGIE
jgi:hypothetical protein